MTMILNGLFILAFGAALAATLAGATSLAIGALVVALAVGFFVVGRE